MLWYNAMANQFLAAIPLAAILLACNPRGLIDVVTDQYPHVTAV